MYDNEIFTTMDALSAKDAEIARLESKVERAKKKIYDGNMRIAAKDTAFDVSDFHDAMRIIREVDVILREDK